MTTIEKQRQKKAVEDMMASEGWGIVREALQADIVTAAMVLCEGPNMTDKEVTFRRGAMWAAKQLVFVPEKLVAKFENDILLDRAMKPESDPNSTTDSPA